MDGYGLVAMYKSDWIRVGGKTKIIYPLPKLG